MKDPVFYARCPCCDAKLAVDTRLRRLDPLDKEKAKRPSILDQAGEVLDADETKRQASFKRAFEEETKGDKPSLDDLL